MFAGCRICSPAHDLKWTFPFGGFGTFLSRGSLERFMQPIVCDNDNYNHNNDNDVNVSVDRQKGSSSNNGNNNIDGDSDRDDDHEQSRFEQAICDKYQAGRHNNSSSNNNNNTTKQQPHYEYSYPFNATIGESQFFHSGMSLNDMFTKNIHEMELFCLHSDFFFGYIANFLNISRHVVPNGEKPKFGQGQTSQWFDEFDTDKDVAENRLHTIMGSEYYNNIPQGNCLFGNGNMNRPNQVKTAYMWIPPPLKGKGKYGHSNKVNQDCMANSTICHHMNKHDMEQVHKMSTSTSLE